MFHPALLAAARTAGPGPVLIAQVVGDRWYARAFAVLAVIALAWIAHRLVRALIGRFERRLEADMRRRISRSRRLGSGGSTVETRRSQRLYAIGGAVRSGLGILIWLAAVLASLSMFFDLRPVLAGAGLAGLVVGFGAQNLIRDLLAGFSMLVEDQFGVGDWIQVDDAFGEVESVSLRSTRFRDMDGVVWHVPNGSIQRVGNLTQKWARATLDVPVALDTDIARARRIIQEVADGLAADPEWSQDIIAPPEIWGVQTWGPEGVSIRTVIATRPLRNWDVNRQMRERLAYAFGQEGIRMPAPMMEVGAQRTGEPVRLQEADPKARRTAARAPVRRQLQHLETTGRISTTEPPTTTAGRPAG